MYFSVFRRATALLFGLSAITAWGASSANLDQQFNQNVRPFVLKYCAGCHSGETPAASFDLKSYASMDTVIRDYPRWALVHDKLAAKQMPPKPMPVRVRKSRRVKMESANEGECSRRYFSEGELGSGCIRE